MRAVGNHDFADASHMINAYVLIRLNPRAEWLASLSRPARRITRRQSTDAINLNRPQQSVMLPRRMSISGTPAANLGQQPLTRGHILEQLNMPGLLQLDEVSFGILLF